MTEEERNSKIKQEMRELKKKSSHDITVSSKYGHVWLKKKTKMVAAVTPSRDFKSVVYKVAVGDITVAL